MAELILGLAAIALGLVVTFAGLQVFFATLPIIGFIFGFVLGGAAVQAIFGDGFLSTVTSWVVGVAVGIAFAGIAGLWWYAGALISTGSLGAVLGTGLVKVFGGSSDWLLVIFGIAGFAMLFMIAFLLALPVYIVIFNSGFVGATVVIAGILLLFQQIKTEEIGHGPAIAILNESWWLAIPWLVLAIVGILTQLSKMATVTLPDDHRTPAWGARA
ncbi:MAG: DUF4203 domain-containing protein [Thermomicrobiales bacterium]